MRSKLFKTGAYLGLLGVCLGAFGSHALRPLLETNGTVETYKTGILYHLIHALLIVIVSNSRFHNSKSAKTISFLCLGGIIFFSGSLYLLSTLGWKWLGPITPVGGVLLIAAWGVGIWSAKEN